jgi:hypothetical protein
VSLTSLFRRCGDLNKVKAMGGSFLELGCAAGVADSTSSCRPRRCGIVGKSGLLKRT